MTRRCSHCCNNGHNSRTCPSRGGVKLFGVRLTDGSMKKSASMGNLSSAQYHFPSSPPNPSASPPPSDPHPQGYVSDDETHRNERKKGIPWTEEEHRRFLMGLQKLGKGDWRGIARNYVVSRTPTQVASHAQKYFIRQSNASRRKRRSSLFDMVPDVPSDPHLVPEEHQGVYSSAAETSEVNPLPSLGLSLDQTCEPMESSSENTPVEPEEPVASCHLPPMIPSFIPAYVPVPYPFWPPNLAPTGEMGTHQVIRPTPVHSKEPVNVDELVGMSNLNLREAADGGVGRSGLSSELLSAPSRQSAFHANPAVGGSDFSQNDVNAIHAV